MVPALPAAAFGNDQVGVLQNAQVLHHGAPVEVGEMGTQTASGQRLVAKVVEDLPPDSMAKRLEDAVVGEGPVREQV